MLPPSPILKRLYHSTVVWSWIFNGFRLGSGLILLPLLLNKLPKAELGMYYIFLSLIALVPIIDFGFWPTIGRFVSYAMGGADTIQSHGIAKVGSSATANYVLLWQLLFTTRALYRYLTLAVLVLMGAWGTYLVELRIHETASPSLTRLAWCVTLVAAVFDIYSNWWVVYLRGMNEVLVAARLGVVVLAVRLVLAGALLLGGFGLLSIPVGNFIGSFLQRHWARLRCLELLAGHPPPDKVDIKGNLRKLWPNSWRLGVQLMSGYLTVNANTAICLYTLELEANAQYGLSIQLINIAVGMAAVWDRVKWPIIGQYRARHDHAALQRILWPRVWLQNLTYAILAGGLLLCGPFLLEWFGGGKTILPRHWFGLLMLNSFLEMQFTIWGTLLFTENRLPYLWPTVATNVLSLALSLTLIQFSSLGLGALVLGPLLAGSLFNYWYWPLAGAKNIQTRWLRFTFSRAP